MQALYSEADRIVDAHWKAVAGRKKELEDRLKAITPVTEPASGDIYLNLVVNEQLPQEAAKDETVVVVGQAGPHERTRDSLLARQDHAAGGQVEAGGPSRTLITGGQRKIA